MKKTIKKTTNYEYDKKGQLVKSEEIIEEEDEFVPAPIYYYPLLPQINYWWCSYCGYYVGTYHIHNHYMPAPNYTEPYGIVTTTGNTANTWWISSN